MFGVKRAVCPYRPYTEDVGSFYHVLSESGDDAGKHERDTGRLHDY